MMTNKNCHPTLENEKELWNGNFHFIAGVDEAGRGPLAGPLVAAAVVFLKDSNIPLSVNDSKKLTRKQREVLFDEIISSAYAYSIVEISNEDIDSINILNATHKAMKKAVLNIKNVQFALIDGLPVKNFPIPSKSIIKGDSKSVFIAAASILAKVHRDGLMENFANLYPEYGFEKHNGYGTKAHVSAIQKYGPSPIHRKTFEPIKSLLKKEQLFQPDLGLYI